MEKGTKMEKSRVHSNLLIVCLALGLLVGQSTASFKACYENCFVSCVIGGKNVAKCAAKCLPDCILPASLVPNLNDAQVFCKLGCASSLCTNFSTKENPAGEKVEGCVDSCSKTRTKI